MGAFAPPRYREFKVHGYRVTEFEPGPGAQSTLGSRAELAREDQVDLAVGHHEDPLGSLSGQPLLDPRQ